MKRLAWVATAVLLIGLGTLIQSRATAEEGMRTGWDINAGLYIPQKSSVRSISGDVGWALEANHLFWSLDRTTAEIGVGYYGGDRVYSLPIMVTATQRYQRYHAGVGLGYAINHGIERSNNSLGYKVFVGIDLRQNPEQHPTYLDITYRGATQIGEELNGLEFSVSYQF